MKATPQLLLALVLALGLLAAPAVAQETDPEEAGGRSRSVELPPGEDAVARPAPARDDSFIKTAANDPGTGLYLVRLADDPVATYDGDVKGYEATRPRSADDELRPSSADARAYVRYLEDRQSQFVRATTRRLGKANVEVVHRYQYGNNGLAMRLTPEEARRVAAMPEVVFVQADELRELHTDQGPGWIGAPALWDGSAVPGGAGSQGEGLVVGVIDTGINPMNPSFLATGGDGYTHTNPRGAGEYLGVCDEGNDSYDPTFPCNEKLIGAYGYDTGPWGATPYDTNGHGSHTASTAAGNVVNDAVVVGRDDPSTTYDATISGVAPHASIISYQACCALTALSAAIDQAIADDVDAINYSIGSAAPSQLWDEFDTVGYLNARAAGIFVATSAGNDGPGDATVGSPSDAPWLTTVAASTHDRHLDNSLVDMAGGSTTPPGAMLGKGFTSGYGPAPIVDAARFGDEFCVDPFEPGTFDGAIVICQRGIAGRVQAGENVAAGGAGGMVLVNEERNRDSVNGDAHVLPAVHIGWSAGVELKAWVGDGAEGHTARITGVTPTIDTDRADILAGFTSRGPSRSNDTITPHVAAPGVDIMAAYGAAVTQDDTTPDMGLVEWSFVSGTSMASPHVAGAGLLMQAAQPTWSMAEIQSALMMTAHTDVLDDDAETPANPFDMGSGRVDLTVAAQAGLVMHETIANYNAANPAVGGNPQTLNLPSMASSQCLQECTWTRTVRSTQTGPVEWTVTTDDPDVTVDPAVFALEGIADTQELTTTIDVSGDTHDEWVFADVVLSTDAAGIPDAHMPIAALTSGGIFPTHVVIDTRRNAGSKVIPDVVAPEITGLTLDVDGLTRGTRLDEELDQDPTSDAFDDLDQVFWTTTEVPANAVRLVAEIGETTSADVGLFVGTGDTPTALTTVCASESGHSTARCDIDDPAGGTYWVLVQNWAGSGSQPDPFSLFLATVPDADLGNATATGPATNPSGQPFDIRFFWETPEMVAGDRWYGQLIMGTDPSAPGDIGEIAIDVRRHADDVTKVADSATAAPGNTVTYTVAVQPNVTSTDLTYTITDDIPAGMTYVPGSATGGATFDDGTLTWTAVMPAPSQLASDMTTSAVDPACQEPATPLTDGPAGCVDDHLLAPDAVRFTYQVTVDAAAAPGVITNDAIHDTDDPGSLPDVASAAVMVSAPVAPVLESLTVTPDTASVPVGGTRQLTATASYDDGSNDDVTDEAAWSSSAQGVATIDGSGVATGVGEGTTTITATFEGESDAAAVTVAGTEPGAPVGTFRLSGSGRLQTAVEISADTFADGAAGAVVLARADTFPDALAGTPLAVDRDAPMLLSPTESLHMVTRQEILRVLPEGSTVYLLGGSSALSPAVESELEALGYTMVRLAGSTRIETARAVAEELGNPETLLITTGYDFPDALAAGAAAADIGGAVLLTTAEAPHAALTAYLAAHPTARTYAVGGPAARAYPAATAVSGSTREGTAVRVAETFFDDPTVIGFARRDDFPDALAGGAHVGRLGGPLLLTPTGMLHPAPAVYTCANAATLQTAYGYGGTSALSADALAALAARVDGDGC